ncbi:transposase [Archangium minus]|uniref:transposase n=1 Tax=Archangium minus TaxID=83450 RepID=UPI0037BE3312
MGWPLRMFQEEGLYFVTSRCFQGRLLLRPSVEVNEVVGGVLARAVQQSAGTIRLHAFTFASNHFHLLVWARGAALAFFMQHLRSNLSRKVGRLVDWSGGFWERRYSAEPVLDDEAMVGRLRYVLGRSSPAQESRGMRSFFASAFAAASGGALASFSFGSASVRGSAASGHGQRQYPGAAFL